jgi:GT2 family glycosyltransferase
LIELEENRGFTGGNNAGIERACGDYLALLNNDAVPQEEWLESLAAAAIETEADFFASKMVLYNDPSTVDTCGDYYSILGVSGKRGHREAATNYTTRRPVFSACAGAAMYSRDLLEDIGTFDDDFFLSYEDIDLGFRARLRGYECYFVPDAIVLHHLSSSIEEDSPTYVYYGQRNLEYVLIKNLPAMLLIRFLPRHIVYNIFAFVYFTWKGQIRAFLLAKRDVVLALPNLLRKRQVIQTKKQVKNSELRKQMTEERLLDRVFRKICP